MAHFQVFHPDHEVIGQTVLEIETAVGGEDIYPFYKKHGLANANPAAWYPMQSLLNVFNDLEQRGGAMFDLISIGMKTVENLVLPPDFASLTVIQLFQLSDTVYHLNSRGSQIGSVACEQIEANHVKLHYITPLPDDFFYGVVYGYSRRFLPRGTHIETYYDPEVPRREMGGEETIIHSQWQLPQR